MKWLAVIALILGTFVLGGCSLFPNVTTYTGPAAVEITDQSAYFTDLETCIAEVKVLPQHFDLSHLAAGAVSGAANGLPAITVNPIVPVLTAAGGIASAAFDDLNVLGVQGRERVNRCMEHKGETSGKYNVVD